MRLLTNPANKLQQTNPNNQTPQKSMLTEDQLELIAEEQMQTLRRCRTMVAGFKATKEKDIEYMDDVMDELLDFMDQGSEAEHLYRDYIAYLSSFTPDLAQRRFLELEDRLGYWTPAVIAAGMVARELHSGQKDKGGHDYFESHLLPVAKSGFSWKEKFVGFLHDAVEDTDYPIEVILQKVQSTLDSLAQRRDDAWKDEFNLVPPPGNSIFFPSEDDWKEIEEALKLLNHNTAPDRESYICRFRGHRLALQVKLNDMRSNMDISRIPSPSPRDLERLERYKAEYNKLTEMLRDTYK